MTFTDAVLKTLSEALSGPDWGYSNTYFVFPSEIIASSWASGLARRETIAPSAHFLSWDRFKEAVFFGTREERPANGLFRQLFAEDLLRKNAAEGFLRRMVPPAYAQNTEVYLPSLVQCLPLLNSMAENSGLETLVGEHLAADIAVVHLRYREFLTRYGRYEPGWEFAEYKSDGKHYIIFWPELLDDYGEYREQLSISDDITLITVENMHRHNPPDEDHVRVRRIYEDYRQELHSVLREVAGLLQAGTHPSEICISIAGFESIYPRLEYIAREMGIPVARRRGQPLLEYPSVSWLQDIATLKSNSYSFASMRQFLKNPGLPWKRQNEVEALLLAAVDSGLVEGGKRRWQTLAAKKAPAFATLLDDLEAIANSPDVAVLYAAIYRFLEQHINTSGWNTLDEAVWQRSAAETSGLRDALEEFDGLEYVPFALLLQRLQNTSYQAQEHGAAVSLFEYRVAAGIHIAHHFVINVNAEAGSVSAASVPFIRDQVARSLFPHLVDSSEAFYAAYGLSGLNVSMSCSRSVHSGAVTPAPVLIGAEEITGAAPLPPVRSAEQNFHRPWNDRTLMLGKDVWTEAVRIFQSAGKPGDKISVTDLEAHIHCPLNYFWSKLHIEDTPLHPDNLNYREIGTAFHQVLENIYRRIAEDSDNRGVFMSSKLDEYKTHADTEVARIFGANRRQHLASLPRYRLISLQSDFLHAIYSILTSDAGMFDGHTVFAVELMVEKEFVLPDGSGFYLRGKIDRIMQDPGDLSLSLIDYKSGKTPGVSQVLGSLTDYLPGKNDYDPQKDGEYAELFKSVDNPHPRIQLPAYALLLGDSSHTIRRLGYYSMKSGLSEYGGTYTAIMDLPEAELLQKTGKIQHHILLEALQAEVVGKSESLVSSRSSGDFRKLEFGCPGCRFKSVCRDSFAVRMEAER